MIEQSITASQENKSISVSNSNTSNKNNPLQILVKKIVFLDLNNSYELYKTLKECLNMIEAKVADCLSKDVDYLITNRSNVLASNDRDLSSKRFKTSPSAQINLLHAKSLQINRTHSILAKASKVNTSIDAVSTATRLGIKVINVIELEPYLQKFNRKSLNKSKEMNNTKHETAKRESLEKKTNIFKLKSPFIKFESICKQYKPVYCEFKVWHDIDFDSFLKNTSSPFQNYFSDESNKGSPVDSHSIPSNTNNTTQSNKILNTTAASNNTPLGLNNSTNKSSKTNLTAAPAVRSPTNIDWLTRKTSNSILSQVKKDIKKKTGYCECCKQKYDNLKQHLTSVQHENFEKNLENFKEIDELIRGCLNFERYLISTNLKNECIVSTDTNSDKQSNSADPFHNSINSVNQSKKNENSSRKSNDNLAKASPPNLMQSFTHACTQNESPGNNENENESKLSISNTNYSINNEKMTLSVAFLSKESNDRISQVNKTDIKLEDGETDTNNDLKPKNQIGSVENQTNESKNINLLNNSKEANNISPIFKESLVVSNNTSLKTNETCENDENSDEFNCHDDMIIAAFINDFSYEVVNSQDNNENE